MSGGPATTGPVRLGCIADDLTGATDLADTLVRSGLGTTLRIGVPEDAPGDEAEALIVALRTRTIPVAEAVRQSLAALSRLVDAGAERFYFKVCSTFDSTDEGNIGPVADALANALGARLTLVSPAFPANGRTVYAGHLFVGDQLLSESPMRHHPLTPMTDSDLVAVLGRQSRWPVALVPLADVRAGPAAVEASLRRLAGAGSGGLHVIADATEDVDLDVLGRTAVALDLPLCVGGSGLAGGLARTLATGGATAGAADSSASDGPAVIVAGSCSAATRAQVAAFVEAAAGPCLEVDPLRLPADADRLAAELRAALRATDAKPVLVFSSAGPDRVAEVQAALGPAEAAAQVEAALGELARVAVEAGARRLIVAGGETAGAVTAALGLRRLDVGATIAPGVPWTTAELPDGLGRLALALKSGNFGGPDFFGRALAVLDEGESAP